MTNVYRDLARRFFNDPQSNIVASKQLTLLEDCKVQDSPKSEFLVKLVDIGLVVYVSSCTLGYDSGDAQAISL